MYEYHKKTHFKAAEEIAKNIINTKKYFNNENNINHNIYQPSLTESSINRKKKKNLITRTIFNHKRKIQNKYIKYLL